jgi:hypothetical protein
LGTISIEYQWSSLSDLVENDRFSVLADIMSDLEVAESAGTLSMHNSLGNALSVEVCHLVDVDCVLDEERTSWTRCHRVEAIAYWRAKSRR